MSDDYDCTGTIGQQHCGSKGGVAVCNAQGRSAALESTLQVLVIEQAMWKVKIVWRGSASIYQSAKSLRSSCVVRCVFLPTPGRPTVWGFGGDLRASGAFSINVLAVTLQIVEFEST